MTLRKLTDKAARMGYTVEDDRDNATLHVHAPAEKGWDDGALTSLTEPYGSWGSYEPAWRTKALAEMFERLDSYPPETLKAAE